MPRLEKKHSLATRVFHWANVPILAVMIWSGLLIYWANDVYEIKVGGVTLIKFFPDWFYKRFSVGYRLGEGMAWHFAFMWLFALNGLAYVAYTFASGEWRHLVPNRQTFGEAFQVVLHDLHIRREPLPRRKFNGAQRLAYTGVIAMGAGSLLTGLAIYKPVQLAWLASALGGYQAARLEHFALTILYVLFFLVHIAQVVKAGWNNARAMIIGVEVTPDGEPSHDEADWEGLAPFDDEAARRLRGMTRRGLAIGGAATLATLAGWRWIASRSPDQGVPWPLRRVLEFDERVGRAGFSPSRLAPEFPASAARMPKVNGRIGIDRRLDLDAWRLKVSGSGGAMSYTLAEIRALPRFEMTTELKCIEGWSEVVTWAGARLVDLASASGLATRSGRPVNLAGSPGDVLPYASLMTPDQAYFVGLEAEGAYHPQTLLCYEMNGRPLESLHGAPLRLSVPIKYGIKSLKQIGTLAFTDARPADYWAEKGYDWYAGH